MSIKVGDRVRGPRTASLPGDGEISGVVVEAKPGQSVVVKLDPGQSGWKHPDHGLCWYRSESELVVEAPSEAARRKAIPLCTGVLDYFPDALMAVAECSRVGNEQHNPGEPLHWAKEKSTDEPDALMRHLVDRGKLDSDGIRHSAKVAWRALALLQREIEAEREKVGSTAGWVIRDDDPDCRDVYRYRDSRLWNAALRAERGVLPFATKEEAELYIANSGVKTCRVVPASELPR